MSGEMVKDRAFLGLLLVVGGSSLLWGLYTIFYVSVTAPSGIFNTVLGLTVLLVTWAFLFPYVLPSARRNPSPGAALVSPPRPAGPVVSARPPASRPAPPRAPSTPSRPRGVAAVPAARPAPRAAPTARPAPTPVRPAPLAPQTSTPAPKPNRNPPIADREVEEILKDLPEPIDADLASANADEVIRRIDALLRDLAGNGEPAPSSRPG